MIRVTMSPNFRHPDRPDTLDTQTLPEPRAAPCNSVGRRWARPAGVYNATVLLQRHHGGSLPHRNPVQARKDDSERAVAVARPLHRTPRPATPYLVQRSHRSPLKTAALSALPRLRCGRGSAASAHVWATEMTLGMAARPAAVVKGHFARGSGAVCRVVGVVV